MSEGAFINAATRIATLQRLDRLKIDFSMPEKYAGAITLGSADAFHRRGRRSNASKGEIYALDPRIDAATRTVLVRAVCPNPEGRLLPGAFASVEVMLAQLEEAMLVPAVAVVPGLNEKNVFVVEGRQGGAARRRNGHAARKHGAHSRPGLAAGRRRDHFGLAADARRARLSVVIGESADMTLAEISIRRPVLTIVMSLLIMLAGAISLTQLGVREYPAVDPPTMSITTSYPGAAAEVVQAQITEPIEEAVNSVAGIRTLTSTSREGASQISAEFSLDTNLDTAASDVRDQMARAVRNLPPDANPPILNKAHADSTPIFGLALSSERRTQLELGAYADALRERLQTVPGIAGVDQPAEKRYAMRLWMDPEKLAAYNLTPLDVRQALERENIELPSGRIEGEAIELPVKTLSRLNTPEEFNALIVKRSGDSIVRFRDIGYAELGAQNERGALKMGDMPIAGPVFQAAAGREPDRDRR